MRRFYVLAGGSVAILLLQEALVRAMAASAEALSTGFVSPG